MEFVMVDDIKKYRNNTVELNEQLRKNYKAISSNNSGGLDTNTSISNLSDTIKMSVDAIRNLAKAYESKESNSQQDIAAENRHSAYATPEDLVKIKENANETGSAIHFNKNLALSAHGEDLDSDAVLKLLND